MKITNHLYGGTVDIVFESFRHQYTCEGRVIPGCTTALGILSKPALLYWAANMASDYWRDNIKPGQSLDEIQIDQLWQRAKKAHTQKKTDSASLGSFVHKWVEEYIKGTNPELPINPEMRGSVQKFLDWVKEHKVEFLLSEQLVFSKEYEYAGTTDFICKIDGKLWLGDLKTSNGIYDEYVAQCASYLNARVEEFPGEAYSGIIIVRVGKDDAELETLTKETGDLDPYFRLFLNCLATYRSLKEIEEIKK